jgi:DNA-binding NtrC family response regulator
MNGTLQSATCDRAALRSADDKSILIVEDETLVAWDIEQTLSDNDFPRIMLTRSVSGARELQSIADQIELVILDLKLEDGDGSVLIDEFADLGIAVLVVTGYGGFAHAHVPVLYKPFATSALLQSINSLLAGRQ